jgi:hypothetical protein
MACCILGAVIFGAIFSFWEKVKVLFGMKTNDLNHVASWTLAQQDTVVAPETVQQRPFIAPRMALALVAICLILAGAYYLINRSTADISSSPCQIDSTDADCTATLQTP